MVETARGIGEFAEPLSVKILSSKNPFLSSHIKGKAILSKGIHSTFILTMSKDEISIPPVAVPAEKKKKKEPVHAVAEKITKKKLKRKTKTPSGLVVAAIGKKKDAADIKPPNFEFAKHLFQSNSLSIPDNTMSFMPLKRKNNEMVPLCFHGKPVLFTEAKKVITRDNRNFTIPASYSCNEEPQCAYNFTDENLKWWLNWMGANAVTYLPVQFVCSKHPNVTCRFTTALDANAAKKNPVVKCGFKTGAGQGTRYCNAELELGQPPVTAAQLKVKTGEKSGKLNLFKDNVPANEKELDSSSLAQFDVGSSDDEDDDGDEEDNPSTSEKKEDSESEMSD